MNKIIINKKSEFDFSTVITGTNVVESDKISEEIAGNLDVIYIPVSDIPKEIHESIGLKVYFDLESYPFYHAIKNVIEKEVKPKGILRFRRMVKHREKESLFASDLFVLITLLGEVETIQVKQTDKNLVPSHTIVLINFGNGTMAHIEYTIFNHERIELEWSGVKNIIEFDSDEVRQLQQGNGKSCSLVYTADAILKSAHTIDQSLINQLTHYEELINGGVIQ